MPTTNRLGFNAAGALFGWACVGTLLLLLMAVVPPSEAAENTEPKTSIPKIANIAGIKVGYSSMQELEKNLGKGKVTIGGHPNGARLWRVKGTSWVIFADAFCYSERGSVVDHLDITVDPGWSGHDLPHARLTPKALAWAGGVSLGINGQICSSS